MKITELVLLILNFTSCIVCLWLSLLKQKLNTTRSMCNVERAPYFLGGYKILLKSTKDNKHTTHIQNTLFT